MKKILTLIFCTSMLLALPANSYAMASAIIMEQPETNTVSVSVSESTLHVTGASGQVLYIYNVAGICVKTIKVESNDKRFDLNLPKGCYIIKVGKTVRKISIH